MSMDLVLFYDNHAASFTSQEVVQLLLNRLHNQRFLIVEMLNIEASYSVPCMKCNQPNKN